MGGAGRTRRCRLGSAGGWIALVAVCGCAGPLVAADGGFRHERHGYRIDAPPSRDPPWQRVEVEDAALAYRRPGGVWMTLSSRCDIPLSQPQILARHLRIGLPEHTLRQAGPTAAGDLPGWQQIFDTVDGGRVVRVKTVTLLLGDCAIDAVLSVGGGGGFEELEPDFDAWWESLRRVGPGPEEASS